jgi:hypothetical protein
MYIRTYEFPAVWVHEHDAYIHAVHRADMSSSVFAPPEDLDAFREFKKAAKEMGYSNVMRYATEHELAHQHVSLAMGRECSWIVWNDAHKDNPLIMATNGRIVRKTKNTLSIVYNVSSILASRTPKAACVVSLVIVSKP